MHPTAAAAAAAAGFVGLNAHISRHEAMKSLPPYDEFRLLEESWQGMKPAVEHQVAVLQKNVTVSGAPPARPPCDGSVSA